MRFDRLLLASAACALMAGAATAQTTTTSTSTSTSSTSPGAAAAGQMSTGTTGVTTSTTTTTASAPFTPITPAAGANIVSVLQASGQFTTFLKAVAATNLTGVLQQPGNLTVFAPTDAAFAALPPGQLASLMQPANAGQLQQLVLMHVVNTPIRSAELLNHAFINIPSVATGKSVHLDGSTGTLKVDGTPVLQSDVRASNGAIFVIGQVLSPTYVAPTTSEAADVPAATTETAATTDTKSTTTKSTTTTSKKRKK